MRIEHVHPSHIAAIWPQIEPMLALAMAHSAGEYTLEQLKVYLVTGIQQLLVFVDDEAGGICGALTVATEVFPNKCVAFVTSIAGRAIAVDGNFDQFKAWCKSKGFTDIRGAAFEAVARLWRKFNAKEIYRVVEIPL